MQEIESRARGRLGSRLLVQSFQESLLRGIIESIQRIR